MLLGALSIFAALLRVAFVSDGESGRLAHCRNNLNPLTKMIYQYTMNYDGYLPAFWHERWVGELGLVGRRYGSLPDDLDPAIPTLWSNPGPACAHFPIRSGAKMLVCMSDPRPFRCDQGCPVSYMGLAKYGWWHRGIGPDAPPAYEYHQVQEFDHPERRILLAETVPGTWQYGLCGCRWHASRHPVEVVPRHYGGGNILFFDGHAQLVKDPEKRTIRYWEPDYDQVTPGWRPRPGAEAAPGW